MVGDLGLMKAGPSASRSVNGPGTHLWRMRSEDSSVHGVMGVVVLLVSENLEIIHYENQVRVNKSFFIQEAGILGRRLGSGSKPCQRESEQPFKAKTKRKKNQRTKKVKEQQQLQ